MTKKLMPIILLEGMVPFPKNNYSINIEQNEDIEGIRAALGNDNYIFLANMHDASTGMKDDNIKRIGVTARIKNAMRGLDGNVKINVEAMERAFCSGIEQQEDFYLCSVDSVNEIQVINPDENAASMEALQDLFNKYRSITPISSGVLLNEIRTIKNLGELCDKLGDKIIKTLKDKRAILEESDIAERALLTIQAMERENLRTNIKNDIMIKARENMEEQQKEYFLREELKAINDELGDKSGVGEEISDYRKRMDEKNLPDYAVEKLEKEFDRLKSGQISQEASYIRDYIDTVLELPWAYVTEENKDIVKAEKILNEDHYGLEKVKERIVEYLAVRMRVNDLNAPILCLVGPPGVGKTSIAKSIARATGRNFVRMSLGGLSDEAEIRGHRRTYIGSMPGRIITSIRQAKSSNPLMLLDEIDKLGSSYKGDPSSAFLEVLDGEQNSTFRDNYLEMAYDLSKVLFVCTANSLDTIPGPLRDRLEIVELSSYTAQEKLHIAEDFLIPKQLKAHGLTKKELKFRTKAVEELIDCYTREAGVRSLERLIGSICRKAIKEKLTNDDKNISVTAKNLTDYLGRKKFLPETIAAKDEVGICRGLAWTSVGGCTLNVEVNILKGKGNFKITGNIGKVMEESYNAALSYIRANSDKLGIDINFDETDIHIHIPEGATPKDGPSAGITMATAMISAMTDKPVRKDIAMTGEISIRGKVMPIGGLKEKVLAAKRAGVKKVIIPIENGPDLDEIPEYGKADMEFVLASKMQDVLSNSLVK